MLFASHLQEIIFLASSVISCADKKVMLQKQRTTMSNLKKSAGIH